MKSSCENKRWNIDLRYSNLYFKSLRGNWRNEKWNNSVFTWSKVTFDSFDMETNTAGILTGFGALMLFVAVVAAMGNGFILYIVKRDPLKCFNKPTNAFNISLIMVHFFGALIFIPFAGVLNILRERFSGDQSLPLAVFKLEALLVNFGIGSASLLFFLISTERAAAVMFPHFNKKWLTVTRAKNISVLTVSLCFLFCLFQFLPNFNAVFYFIFLHVFILLPAFGILVSCVVRLRHFKKQARVSVASSGPFHLAQLFAREARKRTSDWVDKLSTMLSVLFPVLTNLFLFYAVKIVEITCEDCTEKKWFMILSNFNLFFLFLLSAFNPVLLYLRVVEYSRSIKHILRR